MISSTKLEVRYITTTKEDRTTAVSNMHKNHKNVVGLKIARVVPQISWRTQTHTRTHADVLITILRNRSCGRSKNSSSNVSPFKRQSGKTRKDRRTDGQTDTTYCLPFRITRSLRVA